ncbi:hypothetical protein T07_8360 [Trichinella nelsoni]|uniref:Uncharacterized protein n=1 Tax=Trichinella nelsoni TaxID=6336 RepID=A0A0V0SD48_9BILA|nr:hypothetical protein T07_8360 [Trichinella nelsoni]
MSEDCGFIFFLLCPAKMRIHRNQEVSVLKLVAGDIYLCVSWTIVAVSMTMSGLMVSLFCLLHQLYNSSQFIPSQIQSVAIIRNSLPPPSFVLSLCVLHVATPLVLRPRSS